MTTMSTCSPLLVALAVATAVICTFAPSPAAADKDRTIYPCPWRPVTYLDVPFIQKLGRWALDQQHLTMRFDKVESANWQGVDQYKCTSMFSRNYYYELFIAASLRDVERRFRVVVYVTNFTQPQKVISFMDLSRFMPPAPSHAPAVSN